MKCPICESKRVCLTRIEHLCVYAGGVPILEDVNLHLHCGELTAIIGRNGAGKTTFLKALLDEVPHTGSILFESGKKGSSVRRPRFGYVPQRLALESGIPFSVEDMVRSSLSSYPVWLPPRKSDRELVRSVLSVANAEHLSKRRVCDLSGGELQRVMLSMAIHPVPDILLLDEPVSGIDRGGLKLFYELVSRLRKEYDITILLISHDLDIIARHADRVVLIDRSVASQGSVNEVYNSAPFVQTFGHIVLNMTERF